MIRFAERNELKYVAELSQMFADENCCNGIVADNEEYFVDKNVAVAVDNNQIVGFAYGTFEFAQRNRSYIKKDEKIFYVETVYVIPEKRNLKYGEKLFCFLEQYAKEQGASVLELNAVSKDYLSILKFYIEQLGMNFFSAYLYKRI